MSQPPLATRTIEPLAHTTLLSESSNMRRLLDDVETVASSRSPVLITGESGTGKELVARALHAGSQRHQSPFVAVNCAAFPEGLIEAELFGHERGAFTGAMRRRAGRFLSAHGGTLFLDEVGELPAGGQAKLLRVLQEGAFEPVGSDETVRVDVRIVSATHRNLRALVHSGHFRDDLYYRLKVIGLDVPPLRERKQDLPLLVGQFLAEFGIIETARRITVEAWDALRAYSYPGNVRELKHAIEAAVVLARSGPIGLAHLPREIAAAARDHSESPPVPLAEAMKCAERAHLVLALRFAHGHRSLTASLLGISRKTLWEKVRAHGLTAAELADDDAEAASGSPGSASIPKSLA